MEDQVVFSTQVDDQGRILIPSSLRKTLAIRPGAEVLLSVRGTTLSVETRERKLKAIQKRLAALKPKGIDMADELIKERRREAARER